MSPWRTLPLQSPPDGATVWVRLNYWFGPPFLAVWSSISHTFTASVGTAIVYPAWAISRWKPQ